MSKTTHPLHIGLSVEQHAEGSSATWRQRSFAVNAPHYSLRDLVELDGSLTSQIDGLRLAGPIGWELVLGRLCREGVDEVFSAIALGCRESDGILLREALAASKEAAPEPVIASLSWIDWESIRPLGVEFIDDVDSHRRYIGIAVFESHRCDPGIQMSKWLEDSDDSIKARTLQAVGTLGRVDLLDRVAGYARTSDPLIQAKTCWTLALRRRDADAISLLEQIAVGDGPNADISARLLMSVSLVEKACEFIQELAKGNERQVRLAVILTGLLGIPDSVPWLIDMMSHPPYARVAGESFLRITGLRLDQRPYEGDWPEGFEAGPNDDPEDENVEMDEDENLPWPELSAVSTWWDENRGRFRSNVRYLLGFELDNEEWLRKVLVLGRQRERATAALELAIRHPTEPLFNVEEHGRRQMKRLGVKRLPTEEYRCNHIEAGPDDSTWEKYLRCRK